jgi:hypothetical protein
LAMALGYYCYFQFLAHFPHKSADWALVFEDFSVLNSFTYFD